MRVLHLTTPLLHGEDVADVQLILDGRNVFKHSFGPGPIDRVFGVGTGGACVRAKRWLGYAERDCKPIFGDALRGYLNGKKKLTPVMRVRRALRLRKQKRPETIQAKALAYMKRHIGETENPAGSNRIAWASVWYGIIGPWCAMGVTRAYVEAGSKSFQRGSRYAYVPFIVGDARAGRHGLTITHDPKPGDLVCFDWQKDGIADHVGLFERWTGGNEFVSIEGNTSRDNRGSQSNGGGVFERNRHRDLVQAFVHVGR